MDLLTRPLDIYAVPDEILVIILTEICRIDVDCKSNSLLDIIKVKDWQVELIDQYFNICQVCKKFDKLMCSDVLLPFHRVNIYHSNVTNIYTRFNNIECIKTRTVKDPLQQSSIVLNKHSRYIVWCDDLNRCPDVEKRIRQKTIKVIGYRTYSDLINEYVRMMESGEECEYRKFLPKEYESLLTLRYITKQKQLYDYREQIDRSLSKIESKARRDGYDLLGYCELTNRVKSELKYTELDEVLGSVMIWHWSYYD